MHLDGYPRYEAGNRGQTNPAFEPNEPDIPSTESFSQDPDDVRVTAEESKRTSDQSSRKSKDVTQVSSDTKDSKAKEALDKGEKRQIEKKRNEELQNKKEKKNKRTEHGKTKEKEEKSEKGIKEDQGKTIHTENEHEESQYPQKRKEGDKSSKEARLIKYCILVSRHPRRAFCEYNHSKEALIYYSLRQANTETVGLNISVTNGAPSKNDIAHSGDISRAPKYVDRSPHATPQS